MAAPFSAFSSTSVHVPFFPAFAREVPVLEERVFLHVLVLLGAVYGAQGPDGVLTPAIAYQRLAEHATKTPRTIRRWVSSAKAAGHVSIVSDIGKKARFIVHAPPRMLEALSGLSHAEKARIKRWLPKPLPQRNRFRPVRTDRVNPARQADPDYLVSWYYARVLQATGVKPRGLPIDNRIAFERFVAPLVRLPGDPIRPKHLQEFYTIMGHVIDNWQAWVETVSVQRKEQGKSTRGFPEYPPLGFAAKWWDAWRMFAKENGCLAPGPTPSAKVPFKPEVSSATRGRALRQTQTT